MREPTAHELAAIQRCLDGLDRKTRDIAMLKQRIAAMTARRDHAEQAARDRINFIADPTRLADMAGLWATASPHLRRQIDDSYQRMLQEMLAPQLPGSKPLRVDFYRLPAAARPYLLGAYLNLVVGGVMPQLCLAQSDIATGKLVYLVTGGPADAVPWRMALPHIAAWLGDSWTVADSGANTITLVRRAPLPDALPYAPTMLRAGGLMTGIDIETQQPAILPFAAMTSGTFIPGASGAGKSNALHVLLASIFANLELFSAVYLVDGKDGVAFNRYRDTAPGKVHVLWDEAALWQLTSELVATMRQRNIAQREAGLDNASRDFIAVVIDEMSTYTVRPSSDPKHPDNKRHAQFLDELAMLARRGRSTGLRMIITAQEPTQEQIPTTVRANCLTTLAFRLPIDMHATTLFGQLDTLPADPRRLRQGEALLKHGLTGDMRVVKFPLITAAERRP